MGRLNFIEIYGAREHNLKNIDLKIPRNKLVVITGLSGCGKSSLAFDTIFAEGQRRYIESFSAYARQFLGKMERPDVDKIEGLSPVIAIEQKSTSKNPRSTVGTLTELYDFLRLLFSRISDAYDEGGAEMLSYTKEQMLRMIREIYHGQKVLLLAPIVRSRKGSYQELFMKLSKKGYHELRVNKEMLEISPGLKLDRYKIHDVEVVIDKWIVGEISTEGRMEKSIETALDMGDGSLLIKKLDTDQVRWFSKHLMSSSTGLSLALPEPNSFSFNSPKGSCPRCNGLGVTKGLNLNHFVKNPKLSISQGALLPLEMIKPNEWLVSQMKSILEYYGLGLSTPFEEIPENVLQEMYHGVQKEFSQDLKYAAISRKVKIHFEGLVPHLEEIIRTREVKGASSLEKCFSTEEICGTCRGTRLQASALNFKIENHDIAEISTMSLHDLKDWIDGLPKILSERKRTIAQDILKEISKRLEFLLDVGLSYLSLSRSTASLSGGEAQRIRLATQIGSQLVNVLYILDEPSIGLHQRDNQKLIHSLKNLRDIGNSVLVVEHDKDIILQSDHLIDMGPSSGKNGGEVLWQGPPEKISMSKTLTGDYISGKRKIEIPEKRREGNGKKINLKGATGNNLKNVNLELPLGKLVVVTGVSGSGKSSLISDTLYPILSRHFYASLQDPLPYEGIDGLEHIDKVIEVDQTPIGRTPRSNPATYTGIFNDIRALFAVLPESKIRGYKPGRFSFNVKGGRCETCQGGGLRLIEMNFLPDVYVHCEECNGKRFNRETLEVRYKSRSISDVLEMRVDDAVRLFDPFPRIHARLKTLQDVGLGYISLGQQSTTLSGGEAQRVKLATELSKKQTGNTLYILDEPTTGLHFEDIKILMEVVDRLIEKGNTFVIVEHNMDVIKLADHVIDMGPEGGMKGGAIIAEGSPEEIIKNKKSLTARFLIHELKNR